MDGTPLKPLRSITPPNSSLNSSFRIVNGLGEIDEDLEDLRRHLQRAEKGLFHSDDLGDSLSSSSFSTKSRKKVSDSMEGIIKSENKYREDVVALEKENYSLNTELLRVTKENKNLVTEILQKNLRIRELGRISKENVRSSREFQKVSQDLDNLRKENLRLSSEVKSRDEQLFNLRAKVNDSHSNQNERLQNLVSGIELEKSKIVDSEEFLKKQIITLKGEIKKLQETQHQSLNISRMQEGKFEEQKRVDREKIRRMKEKYEEKFEEVNQDFRASHDLMKEDYKKDILYYREELRKRENEIVGLQNLLDQKSKNGVEEV